MQLPGNKTHQKILQLLINLFKKDKNIQAFIVFGSLVRGNWDDYSDLDLDTVVINDSRELVQNEIKQMLKILSTSGFKIFSAFEEFSNEQVIILDSLDRISIRFHTFEETKPAILDSMKVLYGNLSEFDIKKSILQEERKIDLVLLNNKFLELAIYVPISLKRNNLMNAIFFLNKMRQTIIEIYNYTHQINREFDFEQHIDISLKEKFYVTYPQCKKEEIEKAFIQLLDIYSSNIEKISVNKIKLTENQLMLLDNVKKLLN
jgi:predicted nucleotidyltransferase